MSAVQSPYERVNDELTALMRLMEAETEIHAIDALDKQVSQKIGELRALQKSQG